MVNSTPAPCSTTNQRCTPANTENAPSAAMLATLMRNRQALPGGQASSSRVKPPPLRQGCGTVCAQVISRCVTG